MFGEIKTLIMNYSFFFFIIVVRFKKILDFFKMIRYNIQRYVPV